MKKTLKILLTLIITCLCVACQTNNDPQTVSLVGEYQGAHYHITLDALGDKVIKQTQITTLNLDEYDETVKSAIQSSTENFKKIYGELDFTTYSVEYKDNQVVETIILDLSELDYIEQLVEAELLHYQGEDISFVSLKKTVKEFEDNYGLKKQ